MNWKEFTMKYGGGLTKYQNGKEVSYSSVVNPKTKKINLDALNRLQSLLKEQEILAQSKPEGAKALPEIQITAERPGLGSRIKNAVRPYVAPEGGFLDQWRQRIVDETGGADWYKQPNSVLGAFSSVVTSPLQAPQYGAVYAATDKVQLPSEALNIQNPVGAFLTNVALDPMTYLGMGVSKIPQRIGQAAIPSIEQAGKYLATQTPLRNTYNYNPFSVKLNQYNRVVGEDAIMDLQASNLIRSGEGAGLIKRPSAFPSFSKGSPRKTYINQVIESGQTPYIISTDRPMAVSTLGRHGKGTTQFPIGSDYVHGSGNYLSSFPASEATVFEAQPNWLRGYKPVDGDELVDLWRIQERGARPISELAAEGKLGPMFQNEKAIQHFKDREKYFGQWFTKDKADFNFYKADREFVDPEIIQLQVPKSRLTEFQNYDKSLSRAADREFVIPLEQQKLFKKLPDSSSKFKSEIDWAKWNKEIPENTELMKEYNAIEQISKANNTWMKNPDGSKFKGTPEQFVQENSKNFKNSNLNPNKTYRINTRGGNNNPIIHDPSSNIAFTGDEKSARTYTYFSTGDRNSPLLSAIDPPSTRGLHELYATGNKRLTIDAKNASYDNIFYDGKNNKNYRIAEESFLNPEINNVNILNVKNHLEGPKSILEKIIGRKYGNELINKQVSGNYLKSARGNNGMFDMTNPNIYKGLLPYVLPIGAGLGAGALQQNQKPKGTYQGGGNVNDASYMNFVRTLPPNLAQPNDPSYNLRGFWESLGNPESFDYNQPIESDGYYHAFSRNPRTGQILKAPFHPSFKEGVNEEGSYRLVSPRGDIYTQGFKYPAYEGPYALPKRDNVYDFLNKPDYEGYFQTGGEELTGDQVSKFPLKPEEMYYNNRNLGKNPYKQLEFNAQLAPKGTRAVQDYQKMLNDKYGLYLQEEGIWGPKTQEAYNKYVVNKETPTYNPASYTINKGFGSDKNTYTFDDKGKVYGTALRKKPDIEDYEKVSVETPRTKPTIEEFKNVVERGKFNSGYESLVDVDPSSFNVQQGPLTKERTQEIQGLPSVQDLKTQYLGKTFGGLPYFPTAEGMYEGYSPTRVWTSDTPYYEESVITPFSLEYSERGYRKEDKIKKQEALTRPRYAYFLYPKDEKIAKQWQDDPRVGDRSHLFDKDYYSDKPVKDPQALKNIYNYVKQNNQLPEEYNNRNPEEFTKKDWKGFLHHMGMGTYSYNVPFATKAFDKFKTTAELAQNPEIVEYAKKNNIDLNNLIENAGRWPSVGEAILSSRDAKASGIPVGQGPYSGVRTPVIQDPDQFNLVGYLPLTGEGTNVSPRMWTDSEKRKEYARRAGVPENMLDRAFIHTSYFPIEEYKPRKDAQGNIYQVGGESDTFNWDNLNQWFKNGGESEFVNNIYNDYMNGIYDGTPLEENAKKVYDKLNNVYYRQAKESGMTSPNYIMTNVIKNALKSS